MVTSTPYGSPDRSNALRNLKWMVVILLVSNISLGLLSVYLLREMDRRYSTLINHAIPALNDFRELITDTVGAMRMTNPVMFTAQGVSRTDALRNMHAALTREEKFRAGLLAKPDFADDPGLRAALVKASDAFTGSLAEVARLYEAGEIEEAGRVREARLRPVFDVYMASIAKAADFTEQRSLRTSDAYSARTGSLQTIVLGVASWPVLVLVAVVATTAFFLGILVFVMRRSSFSDTKATPNGNASVTKPV